MKFLNFIKKSWEENANQFLKWNFNHFYGNPSLNYCYINQSQLQSRFHCFALFSIDYGYVTCSTIRKRFIVVIQWYDGQSQTNLEYAWWIGSKWSSRIQVSSISKLDDGHVHCLFEIVLFFLILLEIIFKRHWKKEKNGWHHLHHICLLDQNYS